VPSGVPIRHIVAISSNGVPQYKIPENKEGYESYPEADVQHIATSPSTPETDKRQK
jgi:hypothetical protein